VHFGCKWLDLVQFCFHIEQAKLRLGRSRSIERRLPAFEQLMTGDLQE
jgi:hypothetical protein